jgi:integrase/recombinase XerC
MATGFFMPETTAPCLLEFMDHLRYEKRYSTHTVRAYADDLHQCIDFLRVQFEEEDLRKAAPAFIRSWLASLREEGITARSVNRKISSLRSYYKYQVRTGRIEESPMSVIVSPKAGKRLPQYIREEEMQVLFSSVEFPDGYEGRLHRTLLFVFYATGMRLAEVIGLKNGQVDLRNSLLRVLGKGNKERVIPIHPALREVLQEFLEVRKKEIAQAEADNFFLNAKGNKLTPRVVYEIVNRYLSLVTTQEKKSPHILRHSFATHLSNGGADLNAVKALLGHASLAATQVYTHNSIEKLKEVFKKAHPKA